MACIGKQGRACFVARVGFHITRKVRRDDEAKSKASLRISISQDMLTRGRRWSAGREVSCICKAEEYSCARKATQLRERLPAPSGVVSRVNTTPVIYNVVTTCVSGRKPPWPPSYVSHEAVSEYGRRFVRTLLLLL